jgi:hypothetical protein
MKILTFNLALFFALGLSLPGMANERKPSSPPQASNIKVESIISEGNPIGFRIADGNNGVVCYALQSGVSCVPMK